MQYSVSAYISLDQVLCVFNSCQQLCEYNSIINVIYGLVMLLGHICCPDQFPRSRMLPCRFRGSQLWDSFHAGTKYPELIYFLLIFGEWSCGQATGVWPWWSNAQYCNARLKWAATGDSFVLWCVTSNLFPLILLCRGCPISATYWWPHLMHWIK